MLKLLAKLIDRIFVVIGALVFVQAPLFIQQYQHQLIGHVDEIRLQVNSMRAAASQSGKTLEQYIDKFQSSHDADFYLQGRIMSAMVERMQYLSDSLGALNQSTVWSRPFVFLRHYDSAIVKSTWQSYDLGIPLTIEGLGYALAGISVGLFAFACLRSLSQILVLRKSRATL